MEGLEDLITFHRFVKSSGKKQQFQQKKKMVETEILGRAFLSDFTDDDMQFKKGKKIIGIAGQIVG